MLRQRSEQSIHRRRKKIMCQLFFFYIYSRLLHTLYIVVHLDQKRPVFEQVYPYQKHEAKERQNGYSTCANICPGWYFCSHPGNGTSLNDSNSICLFSSFILLSKLKPFWKLYLQDVFRSVEYSRACYVCSSTVFELKSNIFGILDSISIRQIFFVPKKVKNIMT